MISVEVEHVEAGTAVSENLYLIGFLSSKLFAVCCQRVRYAFSTGSTHNDGKAFVTRLVDSTWLVLRKHIGPQSVMCAHVVAQGTRVLSVDNAFPEHSLQRLHFVLVAATDVLIL